MRGYPLRQTGLRLSGRDGPSFAGQVIEVSMQQGAPLNAHRPLFHPDLIKGTSLGEEIKHYSFFSYAPAEALHLSDEEKGIFMDCLEKIKINVGYTPEEYRKL